MNRKKKIEFVRAGFTPNDHGASPKRHEKQAGVTLPLANLTSELIALTAKAMPVVSGEFPSKNRGGAENVGVCPTAETVFPAKDEEIKLTNKFEKRKNHNWLEAKKSKGKE